MTTGENINVMHADRLRAGLLDDDPELSRAVRTALEPGGQLEDSDDVWNRVYEEFEASANENPRLTNQLRIRRRAVLSGKAPNIKRRRFTLPHMAFATAASVALTLGIVSIIGGTAPTEAPVSRALHMAATDLANAYVSNVVDIDLDLTNNVDFYAWMGGRNDLAVEPEGKGT